MASSSVISLPTSNLNSPAFETEPEFVAHYREQTFTFHSDGRVLTRKPFQLDKSRQARLLGLVQDCFEETDALSEPTRECFNIRLHTVRDLAWIQHDLDIYLPLKTRAKCEKLITDLHEQLEVQQRKLAYHAIRVIQPGESLALEGKVVAISGNDKAEPLEEHDSIEIARDIITELEAMKHGSDERQEALLGIKEFIEKFHKDKNLGPLAKQLKRYIKFCAQLHQRTQTAETALTSSLQWQLDAIQKELEPYLAGKDKGSLPEMEPLVQLCDRAFEIINRLKHYQGQLNTLLQDPPTRHTQQAEGLVELLHRKEVTIHDMITEVVRPIETHLSERYEKAFKEINASLNYRKRITRKSKPWLQLAQEPFGTLSNYRRGTRSYLYVDENGQLQYTLSPVHWPDEEEQKKLVAYVKKKVELWKELYRVGTPVEQAKLFETSLELLCGLRAIEEDYVAYDTLSDGVAELREELWRCCQGLRRELELNMRACKEDPKASVYSLLELPQFLYPLSIVRPLFERNYGKRLADRALDLYVEKHEAIAPQVLSREDIQFMLIGIAADVTMDDLKWQWAQQSHSSSESFDKLSDVEILDRLRHFRRDPHGKSLLERFNVPLCWDKQMIEAPYLEKMPTDTLVQNNRKSTIQVLTDIEAASLWSPDRYLRMDDDTMFTRLRDYLKDPIRIDRFSSDRYLHFLEVAAASLSLLERCRTQPKWIDSHLKPIVAALEHTRLASSWSYDEVKFRRSYQMLWTQLLTDIRTAIEKGDFRSGPILEKLMVHPLQAKRRELDPTDLSRQLLNYEYLARRIGYWNSYALEQKKSCYYNSAGFFEEYKYATLRVGSLFSVYEDGKPVVYSVVDVNNKPGYSCQVCMPVRTDRYTAQKKPIPVKLIFQGTLLEKVSLTRDKQFNGPGYALWEDYGISLVIGPLEKALKRLPTGSKARLSFTGHSLGASDAQNAASCLGEQLVKNEGLRKQVESVWVVTFNAAGIPRESEARYAKAHAALPDVFQPVVHSYVPWDYVHFSGETKLGATTPALYLEVTHFNRNRSEFFNWLARHRDYAHVSGAEIRPVRILCEQQDRSVHRRFIHGFSLNRRSIIAKAVGWSKDRDHLKAPLRFFQGVMQSAASRLQDFTFKDLPTIQRELDQLRNQLELLRAERIKLMLAHSWCRDQQELERYEAEMQNIEREIAGTSEDAIRAEETLAKLLQQRSSAAASSSAASSNDHGNVDDSHEDSEN